MCTILQQAFQLVYTEATMEHLTEAIDAGEKGNRKSLLMSAPVSPIKKQMAKEDSLDIEYEGIYTSPDVYYT